MAPRKDFGFIGRLCLDFAQTGDMGWGSGYERLTSAAELQRWFSLSPLHVPGLRIKSKDLDDARLLRKAVWRIAVAMVEDAIPPVAQVRVLNRMARRPGLVKELGFAAKSMHWHRPKISAALATIAQDAVVLFGDSSQRERMRRCNNSKCRVIFYDDSRPGLRRWCAPNRCGNRIRAQLYRRRHR